MLPGEIRVQDKVPVDAIAAGDHGEIKSSAINAPTIFIGADDF